MGRYQEYQNFHNHQPFFFLDVEHYQETVLASSYATHFYTFKTYKTINRTDNDLFMTCIPDGSIDIIFIWQEQQNKMELVGTPYNHKSLIVYPDAEYFGVRLKPGMYFPGESMSVREITDTETFVPQISGKVESLMNQLFQEKNLSQKVKVFQDYIFGFSPEAYTVSETVQEILYLISSSKGTLKISDIAKKICYSERHLTRMFSDAMGYSPKMFSRISRFQYALQQMMKHSTDAVSSFIEVLNYADQSHFQREFKEFTGMTPKRFAKFCTASVCPDKGCVCEQKKMVCPCTKS